MTPIDSIAHILNFVLIESSEVVNLDLKYDFSVEEPLVKFLNDGVADVILSAVLS